MWNTIGLIWHSCSCKNFWRPHNVAGNPTVSSMVLDTENHKHDRKRCAHTGQYGAQKWPQPPPLSLALSGFRLNLTPHTWPLGLGSVLDEWREARAQLWGRVHSRTDSPPTKKEIQLEHISVRAVEYHSFLLTGNIFSSGSRQLPLTSKTAGGLGQGWVGHIEGLSASTLPAVLCSALFLTSNTYCCGHYFQCFCPALSNALQVWCMNGGPSLTLFPRTTNECVVPCSGPDKDR